MKEFFEKGPWLVEFEPDDGGRLSRLCYRGFDLLTTAPNHFKPPSKDYGKYETRPVYGYDDCFPSVEGCKYPGLDWDIPDHGELCWLEWEVDVGENYLVFSVKSRELPVTFKRSMVFEENMLKWFFKVENYRERKLPYQHVMHPLVDIDELVDIELPDFGLIIDEAEGKLDIKSPEILRDYLFSIKSGEAKMLYLLEPKDGNVQWLYKNGIQVNMSFPLELFSCLGIWWDYWGYPAEEGLQRCECAFEPIAGQCSTLMDSYKKGNCHFIEANTEISWEIRWSICSGSL